METAIETMCTWHLISENKPPQNKWVLVCFRVSDRHKPRYEIMQIDEYGKLWNWKRVVDLNETKVHWTELPRMPDDV